MFNGVGPTSFHMRSPKKEVTTGEHVNKWMKKWHGSDMESYMS